ncbi:MAG: cupin-like domain-containing protein [Planctomycetes bacterium]|nr:cupin-like domain-containing protein [Planctomycetota bacterium]
MRKPSLLDNIPRAGTADLETFRREHLETQRPGIFTGLYAGQPIDRIRTTADARRELGDLEFPINPDYYSTRVRGRANESQVCTLATYLDLAASNPDLDLLCTEFRMPAKMRATFQPPNFLALGVKGRPKVMMYTAKQGLFAPLHFDGDHRQVLFTQVFGRKRVMLFPPRAAEQFKPTGIDSDLAVQDLTDAGKRRFLVKHGGFECVLAPGETLFIPKLWWHYLDNLETAMSFGVRFHLSPYDWLLSMLEPDYRLQEVAGRLTSPDGRRLVDPDTFADLLAPRLGGGPLRARARAYERALRRAYTGRGEVAAAAQALARPASHAEVARFGDYLRRAGHPAAEFARALRFFRIARTPDRWSRLDLRVLNFYFRVFRAKGGLL